MGTGLGRSFRVQAEARLDVAVVSTGQLMARGQLWQE